jgi:tetratricopeptide (TPR) repeat protein
LARQNSGLVVISTRLKVDDLKGFVGSSAAGIDLDDLLPEAGAQYLACLGVNGTADELKQASRDFGGHALALTLLGTYLRVAYEGDVRQRDKIAKLTDEKRQGAHARRVMESYEGWFKDKPELTILRLMGLFDRPAQRGALDVLKKEPAIKGLTTRIVALSDGDWRSSVDNLRTARLISSVDPSEPDTLDCHPLLREYFGDRLRAGNSRARREAHSRLYEYYKSVPKKEFPDTIEEMAPLFAAVMHGCQAGKHQEALDEVYCQRIQRGREFFIVKKLGAPGADLSALSGFFDSPWRSPAAGLNQADKGFVLNSAGHHLRALGRLAESVQPMRAALQTAFALNIWARAATAAYGLSDLYLTLGDLKQALAYAEQSVEGADRSDDVFARAFSRAIRAAVLHAAGRMDEAEASFVEAEEMQKRRDPKTRFLYSARGFHYCDLLLSRGDYGDVQNRGSQALELSKQYLGMGLGLLDIGNDRLSLGRAYMLQAQVEGTGDYSQAEAHLEQSVDHLRRAAMQECLVRGLLARAALRRLTGALDKGRHDLDEAFSICTRCGMRLYEADCQLEYARWYLASGDKAKARESLEKARKMIEEMGYHRRDKEVKELEAQLGDE